MTVFKTDQLAGGAYSPPTGFSKFGARYSDIGQEMRVTFKGHFTWPANTMMGKLAWTTGRKSNFIEAFKSLVEACWSEKFVLTNGNERVKPEVVLEPVDRLDQAHMKIEVESGVSTPEMAQFLKSTSKMSMFMAGINIDHAGNAVLRLDEGTILRYGSLVQGSITMQTGTLKDEMGNSLQSQQDRFEEGHNLASGFLTSLGKIPFAKNSSTLDGEGRLAVQKATQYIDSNRQMGRGKIPLVCKGYRTLTESRTLPLQRANAVITYIRSLNRLVDGDFLSAESGGLARSRFVRIAPEPLPTVIAKSDYVVAAHEFGHCLGLPDEYRLYTGMSIEAAHAQYKQLCLNAGVSCQRFPVMSDSIMSCGRRIYKSHYITILDCLQKITNDNTWRIE